MFYKKDIKNLVSKHIFTRWQALLSCFARISYKRVFTRISYKRVFTMIKISVRPSTKYQYGRPLGSQIPRSIRSSMTPLTSFAVQKVIQRLNTIAQIIQNPSKPQNPLVPVQNRFTPLHYQNKLITSSDLQRLQPQHHQLNKIHPINKSLALCQSLL